VKSYDKHEVLERIQMSKRRTISKSYIGIHPECRTGQEVPRLVLEPVPPLRNRGNKKSATRGLTSSREKKASESIRFEL